MQCLVRTAASVFVVAALVGCGLFIPDPNIVSVRVRNESGDAAVLEITEARDEADGPAELIAPPIEIAAGANEVITLRPSGQRWSLSLQGDLGFFYSDDLDGWSQNPDFALVIGEDGVLGRDFGS